MNKTSDEFLEELRVWSYEQHNKCINSDSPVAFSKAVVFFKVFKKIENFQDETKANENGRKND